MKTKIIISLFLSIFILSCKEKKPISLSELFSKNPHYQIKSDVIIIDSLFLGNIWGMDGTDNYLILFDASAYDGKYLSLISISNNKLVKRFGKKGRGPNEIIDPGCLSVDRENENIFLKLSNPPRMIKYAIDSIKNETSYNYKNTVKFDFDDEVVFQSTMLYNRNKYVTTGMFHNGKYGIANINGKVDTVIGDVIKADKHKNISTFNIGNVYQGLIRSHPTGEKFVYVALNSDLIEIVNSDNYITKRFYSCFPKLNNISNSPIISRDNPMGYAYLNVTKKYIYTVFSGKTIREEGGNAFYGNILYVFDWDLKPICSYSLDYNTNSIYITEDDKTMYSVITKDEPVLVKYNLKHSK